MPSPFLSQPGVLSVRTQAAKGSYLAPGATTTSGAYIKFTSGAMGANRDLMIPDPEIGGNRDIPDAALGPISYSGDFNAYCRMEFLATLVQAALGGTSADTGTAATGYTHTIVPANSIKYLSVEEQVGNGFDVFNYTDVKVNTLHLECAANGYLMVTFGLIGITQTGGNTVAVVGNQRYDLSPLLLGTNITVSYNGANLPARSFHIDINNNLETDDFRLGALTLFDIAEKRREVVMGATIRQTDATIWRQAVNAGSAATSPQGGAAVKQQGIITLNSYEDIPGATAGVKYLTTITIPKMAIKPFSMAPSGDDILQNDIELEALRPVQATDLMTVAVRNSYATVA